MDRRVVHGTCPHDCYDTCGLTVTAENGRIVRVDGDADHPITRGFLCFKVNRYLDRLYHSERITVPLKRSGPKGSGQFQPVSWNDALQEVGSALRRIVAESGGQAVLPYSFAGNMGILSGSSMDARFFHAIGASELERTICTASTGAALRWVYGSQLGPDPETIPAARLILLWGTNPMATNVHQIPLLDRAREQGADIWCIDPLRTATVERYGQHLALRPGSDYALALGLAAAIIAQGQHRPDFLERYVTGFDEFEQVAQAWTRERTLAATGLDGGEFDRLVEQLAAVRPILFRTGYGSQRQHDAAKTVWAISCLSLLVGSPQDVGGGHLASNGDAFGLNWDGLTRPDLRTSPVRSVNMLKLGEALLTLDDPPIRALIVYNSNPAATAPEQDSVLKGLARRDLLTIVHEQMMTDTARWADWVFPAAMSLETLDLHTSYWHRYVQLSMPAAEPLGHSVSNPEFFRRLAGAMGWHDPAFTASDEDLIRTALESDAAWMQGITWDALQQQPVQKVRLDPAVRPFIDTGIPRPDGRFNMAPLPVPIAPKDLSPLEPDEFHLLSPSRRETIKSSFGNVASVVKEGRPELLMHPDDIARLALTAGAWVIVYNRYGETRMQLKASRVPQPGTVVSYAVRWNIAAGGSNVNQLTSSTLADYGGGATFYSARARVRPGV